MASTLTGPIFSIWSASFRHFHLHRGARFVVGRRLDLFERVDPRVEVERDLLAQEVECGAGTVEAALRLEERVLGRVPGFARGNRLSSELLHEGLQFRDFGFDAVSERRSARRLSRSTVSS